MKANPWSPITGGPIRSCASLLRSCPGWPGGQWSSRAVALSEASAWSPRLSFRCPRCLSEALPWVEEERSSLSQLDRNKIIFWKDWDSRKYSPGRAEGILCQVEITFFSLNIILDRKCALTWEAVSFLLTRTELVVSAHFWCHFRLLSKEFPLWNSKCIQMTKGKDGGWRQNEEQTLELGFNRGKSFQTKAIKKSIIPHAKCNGAMLYSGHADRLPTVSFKMP